MTRTAVITVVHGRHRHLQRQRETLALSARPPDEHVVVALDDAEVASVVVGPPAAHLVEAAGDSRGLPLAAARNLGARSALEAGAEVLVFLDVDCLAGPALVGGYHDAVIAEPDRVWSGPVTYLPPAGPGGYPLRALASLDAPHPARPAPAPGERVVQSDPDLFWSLSFALHRTAWLRSGGFHEGYLGYGGEDTDFARCLQAAGLGLGWAGEARGYHQHHPVHDPPVEHLDDIVRNGRLFWQRWGEWPMRGWLTRFEELGLVRRSGDGWEITARATPP